MLVSYWRTALTAALLLLALVFALSGARVAAWEALAPLFTWMETTLFGEIGKTWGAAFALVEAFHLLAMALLGGAVLIGDGQLLGIGFQGEAGLAVQQQAHRLFCFALGLLLLTGIFMACGVAMKIYYLEVFWYKMLALSIGIVFVFCIKRPLIRSGAELSPWLARGVAIASLMVWFTVAATGRWIGFSG